MLGLCLLAGAAGAEVRVEVQGVGDQLERNVRAYVGEPPSRESAAVVGAYARRARREARRALESMGYYGAEIEVRQSSDEQGWTVRLRIDPGEPVVVRRLRVEIRGEGADDGAFESVRRRLPLREGRTLNHGEYESAKNALRNVAINRGYFDYRFAESEVRVNAGERQAAVNLVFDTGPRYEFGDVTFSGEVPFSDTLLGRLSPIERGDPYRAESVADLNRRLLDSGYFSDVRVTTSREQAQDRRVPVDVALEERDPNTVGLGLGFSTDEGPRLRANWDRHWLNEDGHQLHSQLHLSQVRQDLTTRYVIPLRDPLMDRLEFDAGWQREDVEDTTSRRLTLGVRRQQEFRSGWTRIQSLRLLEERFEQADDEGRTTLVLPGIAFRRTRSRGGVDPYWGDHQSYALEVADEKLLSDVDVARLVIGQRWLRTFDDRHQVLLRLDAGGIATNSFPDVPASLRFFAGGDQSVRGYGYRTLAPENDEGELVGGRYLLTGSLEYGYQLSRQWRVALFTDAGNAFDDLDEPFKVGSGFGVRWLSPVGPVRLDLAWGVSEDDVPFRVHLSMGSPL